MLALGLDPGVACGLAVVEVPRIGAVRWLALGTIRTSPETMLRAQLAKFPVDVVAIEMAPCVYPRTRFGPSMATAIANAAALGGKLFATAQMLGFTAVEVSAPAWRAALVGRANASDRAIKAALTLRLGGRMPRANEHERDAMGAAIYAALKMGAR